METWRKVWRRGLGPKLGRGGLAALERALVMDDARLVQGVTCSPPPMDVFENSDVEAACALGFCGWQGEGRESVGELADFFARVCTETDDALGEPGLCRFFLTWFDETPRPVMRRELLSEVRRELDRRPAVAA